jgi:hypothetical protein
MKPELTIESLKSEAKEFSHLESMHNEPSLFGVTDGKAVGTYLEHKFQKYLHKSYNYIEGSSAKGIDFPSINVDMKVTSFKQPQSSCPFKSARQKVFGLGYSLIVFVYEKVDNSAQETSKLFIKHTIFIDAEHTADYQTSTGIVNIIDNNGNKDDLISFFEERRLPIDEIEADKLADQLLLKKPTIGYLTISNALQWRLQYSRAISLAGEEYGLTRVY